MFNVNMCDQGAALQIFDCEDESDCNGSQYGLFCTVVRPDTKETLSYIHVHEICNGSPLCMEGEDEENCYVDSTNSGSNVPTCKRTEGGPEVRIFNYTRCTVLSNLANHLLTDGSYCFDYLDQTNCTDPARVGGVCEVGGFTTNLSLYIICHIPRRNPADKRRLCDDGLESECSTCFNSAEHIHKHKMCDGIDDCPDRSDEINLNCKTSAMTEKMCKRKIGRAGIIPIPLIWLHDGIEDCVDGEDEKQDWPKCGKPGTSTGRFVRNNDTCQNVLLCKNSENVGYVNYELLCDGIDTGGSENEVCSIARNVPELQLDATKVDHGEERSVILSPICVQGLQRFRMRFNQLCVYENFIYPTDHIFGFNKKTKILLPEDKKDCNQLFGVPYLYTSCTGRCEDSSCPLKNVPRYEFCPNQYPNRIGTLVDNSYLTFLIKTRDGQYSNSIFVCHNNATCIDYDKVCNLVDDCGDGSDEEGCTNHFQCQKTGDTHLYIPLVKTCDGKFDCPDLSDECNDRCDKKILGSSFLKAMSVGIGGAAIMTNSYIVVKQLFNLKSCRTSVALINKLHSSF